MPKDTYTADATEWTNNLLEDATYLAAKFSSDERVGLLKTCTEALLVRSAVKAFKAEDGEVTHCAEVSHQREF